jgi:NADH dehydrogenase FAD-containing subunit
MSERIVILGRGFAGVSTAQELAKRLRREKHLARANIFDDRARRPDRWMLMDKRLRISNEKRCRGRRHVRVRVSHVLREDHADARHQSS